MKELLRAAMVFMLLLNALAPSAHARQAAAAGDGPTKEEEAEARAVASAFAERLLESHDFAPAVRELYAEDFMTRRLKGESRREAAHAATFMLEGVPSLTFSRTLAAQADAEDWRRVYVAAYNLMNLIFFSLLSRHSMGEPDEFDERTMFDVFPPEAVKVLDANPALSNFLQRHGGEVVVRTPAELRAVAASLEECVRLTRPRFAQMLAKGERLDANLRLFKEASAREKVTAAAGDAEELGYAKGTRLFRIFAPNGYVLLLVKQGGAMKIAWASLPHD